MKHPARLPQELFEGLTILPEPLLDSSKNHYREFNELYRTETSERDRPSLKYCLEANVNDTENKELLSSQRVRDIITCTNCLKPRCIYASSKFNHVQIIAVRRVKDEGVYICGESLFIRDNPLFLSVVVRQCLSCTLSPMETTYYASKSISFPDVCYYCGTKSSICNNDKIKELRKCVQF